MQATWRWRRWRLAGQYSLAVFVAALLALLLVRTCRDFEPVVDRAFLAASEPLVIAHRGASLAATEHTMTAFEEALAAGADVLELDLRLTGDGVPVIAHDRDLERALGVPLAIATTSLVDLRMAVAAAHPDRDPARVLLTFEDVLSRFDAARLNVELKDNETALALAVAELVERAKAHDRVLVASFHSRVLRTFRDLVDGRVATSASVREALAFYGCYQARIPCRPAFEALQIPPSVGSGLISIDLTRRRFLEFARRHGLAVHIWTIDDATELRRLFSLGLDGVMTNDPEVAAAARDASMRDNHAN